MKYVYKLIVFGLFVLTYYVLLEGREMYQGIDSSLVDPFKDKIGFDSIDVSRPIDIGINPSQFSPQDIASWVDLGWLVYRDNVYTKGNQLICRRINLEKENNVLTFELIVSSSGETAAREQIIDIALNINASEIGLIKGPDGLGDICVISPEEWSTQEIIWANHNICAHLIKYETDQKSALNIAREIDSLLNTFIVSDLTKHIPKIDNLEVSAKQIHPDEEIELKIEYSGVEAANALIEFDSPDNSLKYVTQDKTTATFSGKNPGKGLINIYVIDKTTLLSAFKAVEIEIIEPDEK